MKKNHSSKIGYFKEMHCLNVIVAFKEEKREELKYHYELLCKKGENFDPVHKLQLDVLREGSFYDYHDICKGERVNLFHPQLNHVENLREDVSEELNRFIGHFDRLCRMVEHTVKDNFSKVSVAVNFLKFLETFFPYSKINLDHFQEFDTNHYVGIFAYFSQLINELKGIDETTLLSPIIKQYLNESFIPIVHCIKNILYCLTIALEYEEFPDVYYLNVTMKLLKMLKKECTKDFLSFQ